MYFIVTLIDTINLVIENGIINFSAFDCAEPKLILRRCDQIKADHSGLV